MRIAYPFAALPNQVCRGGHGAINIATLAVLLSHGRTFASGKTMAKEVGCSRASIFKAIKYWIDNGGQYGITIRTDPKLGETTVYEVDIDRMEEPVQLIDTPVQQVDRTCLTNGHKEEPINKNPEEEPMDAEFERFWQAYPRKIGKTAAKRHFYSALKRNQTEILWPELIRTILDALREQCKQEQWKKDNGKYIPHPSTWLNGERWNDELKVKSVEVSRFNQVESEQI